MDFFKEIQKQSYSMLKPIYQGASITMVFELFGLDAVASFTYQHFPWYL